MSIYSKFKPKRGFTLIELLVVIAIIAIIAILERMKALTIEFQTPTLFAIAHNLGVLISTFEEGSKT